MKIYIKNMFTKLCKEIVKQELNNLDLTYIFVELGEVEIMEDLDETALNSLKTRLSTYGLELMENKKSILIEKIKSAIVEMIYFNSEPQKLKISSYLSEKLDYDYTYLANIFSEVNGTTIEHYIISHKIEKVKELLIYDEMTLSEISDKLNYSSVAYLSNQFKKVTGLTPSVFRELKEKRRNPIEDIN